MDDLSNPELTLAELMQRWPDVIGVFLKYQMLCVGCQVSPFHTLDDACLEYDLASEDFVAELRAAIRTPSQLGTVRPADAAGAP